MLPSMVTVMVSLACAPRLSVTLTVYCCSTLCPSRRFCVVSKVLSRV